MNAWFAKGVQDARCILRETPVSGTLVFVLLPVVLVGIILYAASCFFQ